MPKTKTISIVDCDFTFIRCPTGSLTMLPTLDAAHKSGHFHVDVSFENRFWMLDAPVSKQQYKAIMRTIPGHVFQASQVDEPRKNRPQVYVTQSEAVAFCEALAALSGFKCHLPTEAEWEFACRAETEGYYSFGDKFEELKKYGYSRARKQWSMKLPKLRKKKPNPWGFFDMHGTVSERCSDPWHDHPTGTLDPTPHSAERFVARGGSYWHDPLDCKSNSRHNVSSTRRSPFTGFRVAADVT